MKEPGQKNEEVEVNQDQPAAFWDEEPHASQQDEEPTVPEEEEPTVPEEEEPTVPEEEEPTVPEEEEHKVPEKEEEHKVPEKEEEHKVPEKEEEHKVPGAKNLLHVLEEHGLIEAVQRQHFNLNEDEGGEEEALFEDDESCNSESCEVLDEAAAPQLMSNVSPCCTFYHR